MPFSDPIADGPVNQRAAAIALQQGVSLEVVFNIVKKVRDCGYTKPIILFGYLNPIMSYGYDNVINRTKQVGVNWLLVVDCYLKKDKNSTFLLKIKVWKLYY